MRFSLFFSLLLFPVSVHGAVIISEVAWMGNTLSANDEWIELYNNGSESVSVDGWTLGDGMNLSIPLLGDISAGAYVVLERTDDESAPGSAFLIYTGALTNEGATLTLRRGDGTIEDQVAGGDAWQSIGGDNATKETAQFTTSGWVTALSTPNGAPSSQGPSEEIPEDTTEETTSNPPKNNSSKSSSSKKQKVELVVKDSVLSVELVGPEVAYVNQPVTFKADASGLGKTILGSLNYAWNFGDLTTAGGKEVKHHFAEAGEYVVNVEVTFGKHTLLVRKEVTVLPTVFMLSKKSNGDIILHNNAKYEVDISDYSLKGVGTFIFPPRTFMRAQASLIIPKEKIEYSGLGSVVLRDQTGATLTRLYGGSVLGLKTTTPLFGISTAKATTAEHTQAMTSPSIQEREEEGTGIEGFSFAKNTASVTKELPEPTAFPNAQFSMEEKNTDDIPKTREKSAVLPYVFLCGLLSLGVLATFSSRFGVKI